MDYFKNYINFEEHVIKSDSPGQKYAKFFTNKNFHGDKGGKLATPGQNLSTLSQWRIYICAQNSHISSDDKDCHFCTFVCLKISILKEKELNFTINACTISRFTINISFS